MPSKTCGRGSRYAMPRATLPPSAILAQDTLAADTQAARNGPLGLSACRKQSRGLVATNFQSMAAFRIYEEEYQGAAPLPIPIKKVESYPQAD